MNEKDNNQAIDFKEAYYQLNEKYQEVDKTVKTLQSECYKKDDTIRELREFIKAQSVYISKMKIPAY